MTLILSIATPEFVLQVSDWRLMRLDGRRATCIEDDANKLTVFCNRMVFGYTGLANIGDQKTDVWLAQTLSKLSDNDLAVVVTQLKERATDAFSRLNCDSEIKRHAFIGVG